MEDSEGGPPQALLGAQGSSGSSLLQACWGIGGSIQTAEELGWSGGEGVQTMDQGLGLGWTEGSVNWDGGL